MLRALWTSATGMEAQQTNLDVISNETLTKNEKKFIIYLDGNIIMLQK